MARNATKMATPPDPRRNANRFHNIFSLFFQTANIFGYLEELTVMDKLVFSDVLEKRPEKLLQMFYKERFILNFDFKRT